MDRDELEKELTSICYDMRIRKAVLSLFAPIIKKADQWDALGYQTAYVEPENYDEIKEKARKYDELLPLVDYMKKRAEYWDKIKEIDKHACKGTGEIKCPVSLHCSNLPCIIEKLVKAIEGAKPKK